MAIMASLLSSLSIVMNLIFELFEHTGTVLEDMNIFLPLTFLQYVLSKFL